MKIDLKQLSQDPATYALLNAATSPLQNSNNQTVSDIGKIASDTIGGVQAGAQIGKYLGPSGVGAGAVIGGIIGAGKGIIGAKRQKQLREEREVEERNKKISMLEDRSRAIIDLFPTAGNEGGGNIYAFGGKLRNAQLVVEAASVRKIGNGYEILGKTHEERGVPAIDEQGRNIELELGEVIVDNMVYTNRLLPTDFLIQSVTSNYKTDIQQNETYADAARNMLNNIEKINSYKFTGSRGSLETNILMTQRYQNVLELLFVDQEMSKSLSNG